MFNDVFDFIGLEVDIDRDNSFPAGQNGEIGDWPFGAVFGQKADFRFGGTFRLNTGAESRGHFKNFFVAVTFSFAALGFEDDAVAVNEGRAEEGFKQVVGGVDFGGFGIGHKGKSIMKGLGLKGEKVGGNL